MVKTLANMNLGISYDRLLNLGICLANSVSKRIDESESGQYCLSHWVTEEQFLYFAIDNIDFLEHTPSVKNSLHGTIFAIYQSASKEDDKEKDILKIDHSN